MQDLRRGRPGAGGPNPRDGVLTRDRRAEADGGDGGQRREGRGRQPRGAFPTTCRGCRVASPFSGGGTRILRSARAPRFAFHSPLPPDPGARAKSAGRAWPPAVTAAAVARLIFGAEFHGCMFPTNPSPGRTPLVSKTEEVRLGERHGVKFAWPTWAARPALHPDSDSRRPASPLTAR